MGAQLRGCQDTHVVQLVRLSPWYTSPSLTEAPPAPRLPPFPSPQPHNLLPISPRLSAPRVFRAPLALRAPSCAPRRCSPLLAAFPVCQNPRRSRRQPFLPSSLNSAGRMQRTLPQPLCHGDPGPPPPLTVELLVCLGFPRSAPRVELPGHTVTPRAQFGVRAVLSRWPRL